MLTMNFFRVQLLIITLFSLSFSLDAQTSKCPRGIQYDCVYGCGRFTDKDNDGYCDYGLLTKKKIEKLDVDVNLEDSFPSKDTVKTDSVAPATKQPNDQQKVTETVTPAIKKKKAPDTSAFQKEKEEIAEIAEEAPKEKMEHDAVYDFFLVSGITIGLYLLTMLLYRRNAIRKFTHRRIWNALLLLTFLVSCIFGLILVIQINYDFWMSAFATLLYWHVEIGISMTLIAIIHIFWHWKYFKNMVVKK